MLETTPVSVDSALQRAHKTVDERLPSHTQQQTLRLARRRRAQPAGRALPRRVGAKRHRRRSSRCSPQDARLVMPPLSDLGQRPRPGRRLPARLHVLGRTGDGGWFLRRPMASPQFAPTVWDEQTAPFMPAQPERPHPARTRGRRDHGLHDPRAISPLRLCPHRSPPDPRQHAPQVRPGTPSSSDVLGAKRSSTRPTHPEPQARSAGRLAWRTRARCLSARCDCPCPLGCGANGTRSWPSAARLRGKLVTRCRVRRGWSAAGRCRS